MNDKDSIKDLLKNTNSNLKLKNNTKPKSTSSPSEAISSRTYYRSQTTLIPESIDQQSLVRKEERRGTIIVEKKEMHHNPTERAIDQSDTNNNTNGQQKKNVRVYVRFRPVNDLENSLLENGVGWLCPEYNDNNKVVSINSTKSQLNNSNNYAFDQVFRSSTAQEEIYNVVGKEIVHDVISGYNGTIFAYGQSGSGKTFTMYGNEIHDEALKGLIPRIVEQIFDFVNRSDYNVQFQFKLSVLQIYKEVIYDLLTGEKDLKIKENPAKGIYVDGLTEVCLVTVDDFMYYADLAQNNRIVSGTKLNQYSSRSHSIMILEVQQTFTNDNITKKGTLNLVDLAGSEKISKTGAVGETLEEAKKINLSLSALGNVIHALTSSSEHIPYRDSKLTRILQESLGGNYKTSLIVACSPHSYHLDETISSLQFAQRAKRIKNKVKVNIKLSYEELQKRIDKLTHLLALANNEIARLKNCGQIPSTALNDQLTLEAQIDNMKSIHQSQELPCPNCIDMKEKIFQLDKQVSSYQIEIKEKDSLIEELQAKLNMKPTPLPTESLPLLYDDIKGILTSLAKDNATLIIDSNERQKISERNIEVNKEIVQQCLKFSNSDNSKIADLFESVNTLVIKALEDNKSPEYQSVYQMYKDNYVKIFDGFFSNDPKLINQDTMKYFLFEYIQFYFSYQLLQHTNKKLNEDNKSLNKMNTILIEIIDDILSKNYELNNNVSSQLNAFNRLKASLVEGGYGKTFAGDNTPQPINEMKDLFVDDFGKMSFACEPKKASSKMLVYVSKKNIDLIKSMRTSNIKSFVYPSISENGGLTPVNNNMLLGNSKEVNEIQFSHEQLSQQMQQQQQQLSNQKLFQSIDLINSKKRDKKISKFTMLKDVLVANIKDGEKFKTTVNEIREEFHKIIHLNEKYVIEKISGLNYHGVSHQSRKNRNIFNGKKSVNDEKEIAMVNVDSLPFKTEQIDLSNHTKDIIATSPRSKVRKTNESTDLIGGNSDDRGLTHLKSHQKFSTEYGDFLFKQTGNSLFNLNSSPQRYRDDIHSQRAREFYTPEEYALKYQQQQSLEEIIGSYLETGTVTRRFDGIKVKYDNKKVECEYAGGLSAHNVINTNPLQKKMQKADGDDGLIDESLGI